jgi:hypothetical protein
MNQSIDYPSKCNWLSLGTREHIEHLLGMIRLRSTSLSNRLPPTEGEIHKRSLTRMVHQHDRSIVHCSYSSFVQFH